MQYDGNLLLDKTKPDGTLRKLLDIEKIQKLGWKSKINLNDGLTRTINEFKKNINE